MDNIYLLFDKINDLKRNQFIINRNNIYYVINNNIKDVNYIEHLLDSMLDCIYDDESLNYYLILCAYLKKLDKESSNFYLKLLKEEDLL